MGDISRELIHFTGHVQGVGFRYSTLQVAKEYEVTGYVSNLPDGRVQLQVEGTDKEIDGFVAAVTERMHGYIRKTDRKRTRGTPLFAGFTIR